MFKLVSDRVVKNWPIKVIVPIDNGETRKYPMKLDLKIIDTDVFREQAAKGDDVVLPTVIVGWSDIQDEQGNPFPFNQDNVKAACKNANFAQAAFAAYIQASSGQGAEKN